jgi:signal transduction histidine kinase
VIHGAENADKTIIEFVNRTREKIDSCVNSTAPSVIIEIEAIKNARLAAFKKRGVKLRYVLEITVDNLNYCKEMLKFSEIRHLEGMKGNFEVADEKEYVAVATLKKAQPIPQLIFSNVPEIVEQQQFVFDSFWEKAIPSEQRITELEKGIKSSVTTIFNEYEKAEKKEFDMIRAAKDEIQIIYSTSAAFHLQEKSGTLELLKQVSDQNKNLKISILVPIDYSIRESLSLALLTTASNNNIQIQDIEPSIDIKIKSLVVDKKECLIMELKTLEEEEENMNPPIGFSIYSNSTPTVLSYCSIFEMIYNQSILAQELKHEGIIKDDFINTAAHELRTPTQAITGYSELNDELFKTLIKDRKKMTDEELARIHKKLFDHHESISRNASRLNILTNNLLDVARFESNNSGDIILQKEKVDLVKEIDDLIKIDFGQKTIEKGIKMNFINNSLEEHCWVYSDRLRLNQILVNLIDNAVKFTKRDDSIHIMIKDSDDFELNLNKTGVDETNPVTKNSMNKSDESIQEEEERNSSERERKKINQKEEEGMVYVGISDTGKGISPKILPKLFEKFTTDSDFGTGLGLFITKKLVEAHGERIWAFNNNDGIGSTFVFSLPR